MIKSIGSYAYSYLIQILAASKGYDDVIESLNEKGANLTAVNDFDESAVLAAAKRGKYHSQNLSKTNVFTCFAAHGTYTFFYLFFFIKLRQIYRRLWKNSAFADPERCTHK